MINTKIGNDWDYILKDEFQKDYFLNILKFLEIEYNNKTIYPKKEDVFNAFKITSFKDTKVVILGQDPYIRENQAHGLSFSVKSGEKVPPSLKNIYKEIQSDLDININFSNGELTKWAKEGVLLLNAVLTVEEGKSNSHKSCGWATFTDNVITLLNNRDDTVIFLFWGTFAIKKQKLITNKNHIVLTAPHPSPLARGGFFNCKHFSKTNEILQSLGKKTINWEN